MKPIFAVALLFFTIVASAQPEHGARRRNFNNENYIALRQFDPVSFFKKKPLKGTEKIQYDYKGITYYFATLENLEAFKAAPAKYEPAYGGWCAYTMATTGERARIDPTTYRIMNGKLYLFYNFNGDNRLTKWSNAPNRNSLIAMADKKWKMR
jgi:YHS domain-containing protein